MTDHVKSIFVNPSTAHTEDVSLASTYFDKNVTFDSFQFHPSLQKAIRSLSYAYPSLVQSKAIPYIMEGRNVIVRAQTGTGKTAAYVFPILHKLINLLEDSASHLLTAGSKDSGMALILVPTNQLVPQVADFLRLFIRHIPSLRIAAFTDDNNKTASDQQRELQQIKLSPHVIVSTPDRLLFHLNNSKLSFITSLRYIVFDEADLFITHGYKDTLDELIKNHLPKQQLQSILMSATFTPEVQELRSMAVHNPVVIKLKDESVGRRLHQFFTTVYEHEKFLIFYSHMLQGMYNRKTIFFVNTIETAFRLKMFLTQFGVNSVVLNDDLPYNSRRNIILQFNRGVFKYLIATDLTNSEIDLGVNQSLSDTVSLEVDDETVKTEIVDDSDDGDDDDCNIIVKPEQVSDDEKDDEDEDNEDDDDNDEDIQPPSSKGSKSSKSHALQPSITSRKSKRKRYEESDGEDEDEDEEEPSVDEEGSDDEIKQEQDDDEDDDEDDEIEDHDVKEEETSEDSIKQEDTKVTFNKTHQRRDINQKDSQYKVNVSRGVDFENVHTVVNFDLPLTFEAYTHRIGRTARAGKIGVAVSYVVHGEEQDRFDDMNLKRSISENSDIITATEQNIQPLHVDPSVVESLRVRVGEALNRTGTRLIKEARLEAIRRELLNSERLAKHWELHPDEMVLLNHQNHQPTTKHKSKTIKQLPDYLRPKTVVQTPIHELTEAQKKRRERSRLYKSLKGDGKSDPLKSAGKGKDKSKKKHKFKPKRQRKSKD